MLVVLNQAPSPLAGVEPPAVKRALDALSPLRLPVITVVLRERDSYQSALETGRSVEELDPPADADPEVADPWTFMEGFIYGRRGAERAG